MRRILSAASLLPVLLLAACGGDTPPAQSTATPSAAAAAPAQPAAASDDDLTPLFGAWGLDPSRCDQVIKISRTRFEGAENGCDISSFTDNGDGSYTAAMSCTSHGQTANEQIKMEPVFAPTGEGVELTYINRDNLKTTLLRCGAAEAAD